MILSLTKGEEPMSDVDAVVDGHCPIEIDENDDGPADQRDAVAVVCWCRAGWMCPVIPARLVRWNETEGRLDDLSAFETVIWGQGVSRAEIDMHVAPRVPDGKIVEAR